MSYFERLTQADWQPEAGKTLETGYAQLGDSQKAGGLTRLQSLEGAWLSGGRLMDLGPAGNLMVQAMGGET